jgi:hypothetical protein
MASSLSLRVGGNAEDSEDYSLPGFGDLPNPFVVCYHVGRRHFSSLFGPLLTISDPLY